MILGVGIDTIEIERFADWYDHPKEKLQKLFADQEITYCLESKETSAQRFAARFAAKEAFFKAWQSYCLRHKLKTPEKTLLMLAKQVSVAHLANGCPLLEVDWPTLTDNASFETPQVHVSLTHAKQTATALVIIAS